MTPEQVNILCRLVFDACALFLWGAHGFLWLAVPKNLSAGIAQHLARFYQPALWLLAIAGTGKIAAQSAMLGDGWQNVTSTLMIDLLTATQSGRAFGLQAGLALVLVLGYYTLPRHRGPVVTLLGAPLLMSLSLSGHAVAQGGLLGLLHRANHSLHLLSASLWLGALPPVLLLLNAMQDPRTRTPALTALMRFSTIGHVAVALTLVSGMLNVWLITGLSLDMAASYQQGLALKIAAVAAMVTIAIVNRYVFVPQLHRNPVQALRAIRIGTLAECALGLIAVALVSAFGTMQPG
ncbi:MULTISPECIES: copper homeostasis membrane protein CopD [Rhizobium/Agrobacterium group]|uniref:Cu resistance protein n=2 Tax=Rhizobium/Agrobacterium group TaxID=227290 RepID=B9JUD2_ALLAM|nr:copper homeostasis membrane protein CopD [Allorhizobium ampelinum]MUO28881.1 copper homeostasis membrane protein CopD [Agrobacterium vitis]ACM38055.1 Cu resistance protein [Allorhizobium ampelinum S4]MCF1446848.1 copper homeostasis membrane protein CopD [Allorhizobium ampelinum]MUO42837.1 copper homeostasis membrane protein CopD [Agrobacterium vitis]MUP09851.1 copper homeostasis membrane protein CopD [Agrobacterium vitis]